ncbi:hypothetical protein E3U23_03730 [Erythrobacter litoralis]|uniref:hypothetical protein n=1 Tax=Erythrobacter litoralis TaxID=39960 RepID=UPI002434CA81|nr:hypothetical protein [Erythrobacter litoralis]MDG6078299.1 hypothetical protein [Erythrobacter litoralis]
MPDHPTTFDAEPAVTGQISWEDRASLHRADDGQGVLDGGKGLRSGTFADIINHMLLLPENERDQYVIQKAGDRAYTAAEAERLAARDDFPRRDAE